MDKVRIYRFVFGLITIVIGFALLMPALVFWLVSGEIENTLEYLMLFVVCFGFYSLHKTYDT